MSIPAQNEMFQIVLKQSINMDVFSRKQMRQSLIDVLHLTEEEQEEQTSSGVAVYRSRSGWSISWLTSAGYLEKVGTGRYRISDAGRKIVAENLSAAEFSKKMRAARSMNKSNGSESVHCNIPESEKNPEEILDEADQMLKDQLSSDLMDSIMGIEGKAGDKFFEELVTQLLEKMGYGHGRTTQFTNDGGIDGIIRTDPLGFNPIFIQAKRYSPSNTVGRPEIQAFAGALGAVKAGAFFTTSTFSSGAIEFAKNYPHSDIILIDGQKLTQLMIQYDLGVSSERIIQIKKIDNDFFDV